MYAVNINTCSKLSIMDNGKYVYLRFYQPFTKEFKMELTDITLTT